MALGSVYEIRPPGLERVLDEQRWLEEARTQGPFVLDTFLLSLQTHSPPFSAAREPDVHGPHQQAPLTSGFLRFGQWEAPAIHQKAGVLTEDHSFRQVTLPSSEFPCTLQARGENAQCLPKVSSLRESYTLCPVASLNPTHIFVKCSFSRFSPNSSK